MIERLSGEFIRGYTKAIMDIQEITRYINNELSSRHKQMNYKMIDLLLRCCLKNREKLRDSTAGITDGFIRWNQDKNDFEYFERNKHE